MGDPRAGCSQLLLPPCPLVSPVPPEGAQDRVPASPQGRGTGLRSCYAQAPQALPETQPHISLLGPSCASSLFLPMLWHCTGMFTLFQSNPTAIPVPWQALEKVLGRRHCPRHEQDSRQGHPHTGVGVYGPGSRFLGATPSTSPFPRQQPPTESQLQQFPTSPKHTALFPETTNLKRRKWREIKKKKKKK